MCNNLVSEGLTLSRDQPPSGYGIALSCIDTECTQNGMEWNGAAPIQCGDSVGNRGSYWKSKCVPVGRMTQIPGYPGGWLLSSIPSGALESGSGKTKCYSNAK